MPYLSKITGNFGLKGHEDIYAVHKFIWSFFPNLDKRSRSFLYRHDNSIFLYSQYRPAIPLEPMYNIQKMDIREVNYEESVCIKNNKALFFNLRLNAQSYKKNSSTSRHSIIFHYKKKYPDISISTACYNSVQEWFNEKSSNYGFNVEDFEVSDFKIHSFKKPDQCFVYYNYMDIKGLLKITDRDLFINTLNKGIGTCRAFGCGLLLLENPNYPEPK